MTMTHGKMKPKIDEEMEKAFDSRAEKKEGRARVSARRAAGFAISSYFEDCTGESSTKSAFHLLSWLQDREEISAEVREAARRLTVHVTPDHILPHPEDPLVDAKTIIVAMAEITTEDLEGKSTSLVSGVAGGLTYLAPFHTLIAWLFASFIVAHVYLTTTGPTPFASIKAMMFGWDDVEVHHPEEPELIGPAKEEPIT